MGVARRLRSEHRLNSLPGELACRLSQRGDLVIGLFTRSFSTVAAYITVPDYQVSACCELNPECFRKPKEAVVAQFAKTAFDAGTDIELSGETAKAAAQMTCLVPVVATATPLWSPPRRLPLQNCTA